MGKQTKANTITTYRFKRIEAEDYNRSGPLSETQKKRMILAQAHAFGFDVDIEDPDVETIITQVAL